MGFTQAHSAFVPQGARIGGWVNVTLSEDYGNKEEIGFTWPAGDGARGKSCSSP